MVFLLHGGAVGGGWFDAGPLVFDPLGEFAQVGDWLLTSRRDLGCR